MSSNYVQDSSFKPSVNVGKEQSLRYVVTVFTFQDFSCKFFLLQCHGFFAYPRKLSSLFDNSAYRVRELTGIDSVNHHLSNRDLSFEGFAFGFMVNN